MALKTPAYAPASDGLLFSCHQPGHRNRESQGGSCSCESIGQLIEKFKTRHHRHEIVSDNQIYGLSFDRVRSKASTQRCWILHTHIPDVLRKSAEYCGPFGDRQQGVFVSTPTSYLHGTPSFQESLRSRFDQPIPRFPAINSRALKRE